jgi:MFS family permease
MAPGLLTNRDYRLLWLILVTSGLALWLRILVTAQGLLDSEGDPWRVGLIGAIQLVVQIPALLWGGTLADRFNRKTLMVGAHGLTALTMGGLALLATQGALGPGAIYLAVALSAATQMFANPARAALAIDNGTGNACAVAGPLLFALCTTTLGLPGTFALAALLSAWAAALPLLIRASGHGQDPAAPRGSVGQQTLEGLRYVSRHPILPGLFLLDTGITVVSFYREILPVLALGMFAGGASATGLLGSANAAGAIGGAALALLLASYRAKGRLVLYASLVYALCLFAFGLAEGLLLGAVLLAAVGAADAVTVTVRSSTVMLTTPDAMRGRAFSLMILAAQTANNLGTLWIGFFAGWLGARESMLLGAILAFLATLAIGLLWPPLRAYRAP